MKTRKDFDLLGAAHPNFPLKMVINNLPDNSGIGIFWDTFGDCRPVIRELLKAGKLSFLRIQGHWDPRHLELIPIKKLNQIIRYIQALKDRHPNLVIALSHTCEYYSQDKQKIENRVNRIKKVIPFCIRVNNPSGRGLHTGDAILERHHDVVLTGHERGVSLDGKDATDIDVQRWLDSNKAKALYRFVWMHEFNLREKNKPFVPIEQRTVKVTKQQMHWITSFKW